MARQVFFSFQYEPDNWRVSTVRNIGAIEGNKACSDNDWETVTGGGDGAIRRWINDQMHGRSTTVVLIGANTADRKWINYEIAKTWDDYKALVGIHIHNLKDRDGEKSRKGRNPFDYVSLDNGKKLSEIVKVYDPPYTDSKAVYNFIADNIEDWIEQAQTRKRRGAA